VLEDGGYKLDFRIETHDDVDRVFKYLNIDKSTEIRHMNLELFKWNGREYKKIPVPGYGRPKYHLFFRFQKIIWQESRTIELIM